MSLMGVMGRMGLIGGRRLKKRPKALFVVYIGRVGVMKAATSVSPKKSAIVSHSRSSMMRTATPMPSHRVVPFLDFFSLIV